MNLPDKSTVLFFAVSDSKQNTVDNNSGKGYVVLLKDPSDEGYEQTLVEKIESAGMAGYMPKLEYDEPDILEEYEALFASNPELKNGPVYASYLNVRFFVNKEETRPELVDFAAKMANNDDEMKQVEEVALEKFPKGEVARNKFMMEFYAAQESDEAYVSDKQSQPLGKYL